MLAVSLVLHALLPVDAWLDRAALGADRLAVAAVDEQARTRPLKQLWWSGEGQQVLELLDHRACIGSLEKGCLQGSGLPTKSIRPAIQRRQGRMRWDWSNPANRVLAFEIVGTKAVLWAWRSAVNQAAAAPLTLPQAVTPSDPVDPIKPSAEPQKPTFWHWLALLLIAVGVGRFWGRRGRNPVKDWQGVAEGMEEELERERLRSAVAQGQAMRERDALRHELSKASPQRNTEDLRQIAQLEDRLQRLGKRWLRQRGDLEREAEVSRRDATRFLAPLQQLGIMLRQIERRMRAVDEAEFAQKVQQRRLGLQAFEGRLRDHFSGVVMLDERSWQNCRDELDELLASSLATAEEEAPNEAESGQAKSRRLQVLRGGR